MWYPEWPLRRPDAPRDEPTQVIDDGGIVVAANAPARASGIVPGMRRAEAELRDPTVVTLVRDPGREAILFEPVVAAIEELVPRVEVVGPGTALVPIGGAVGYHGGEARLLERLDEELERVAGPGALLGVASGAFCARRAAERAEPGVPFVVEDDAAFLASLDVGVIGVDALADTFRWLGVTTLGALAALPRDAIVARFGREGLEAHRLASGATPKVVPRPLPEDRAVVVRFDPPLDDAERAAFAGRAAASRLLDRLAAEGVAPHVVEIEIEAGDGSVRRRTWRSLDPFDVAVLTERLRWQLRAWIEGGGRGVRGGIVALGLRPDELSDAGRQLDLFEGTRGDERRALGAVQTIVGPDRLLQALPDGGRDPHERVRWHRWGEPPPRPRRDLDAPWPGRIPDPPPALVPSTAVPLEVEWDAGIPTRVRLGSRWEPVHAWAGPWRRVGRWWDGEPTSDRYQLVTSVGALLCKVEEGRWFLLGLYD